MSFQHEPKKEGITHEMAKIVQPKIYENDAE